MDTIRPIIIVDDDQDDLDFVAEAHTQLEISNPLILLNSPAAILDHLQQEHIDPYLILCDLNLPIMNGIELKQKLLKDDPDRFKIIPFVIWSTGAEVHHIQRAFKTEVQGFFLKPSSFTGLVETYEAILKYWNLSLHPFKLG